MEVQTIWSDDGIAIRLPEGDAPLDGIEALLFPEPDEVEDLVVGTLATSAHVRQPLPRERGPRPAPAATPAGHADPALAAAPAVGRPARGRLALRLVPDPGRDVPGVPVGRLRPAGPARDPGRRRPPRHRHPWRRDGARLAVRGEPHVRLRRRLHVRRRHADRRAPGRRADARSRPAARAARPGGAARAARPGRAGRSRAQPPGPDRRPAGDDARRRPRPAAPAGRPVDRRGGGQDRGRPGDRRAVARRARRGPPGDPDQDRGRRPLARHRGRRPLSRRGRDLATGRYPGRFPRARRGCARRAAGPLGTEPRPVPDTRARPTLGPAGRSRRGCARAAARRRLDAAWRVPAGRRRARMVRSGGPAPPPPAVAGAAAPRGRAGRSRGARTIPARLAGRRPGRAEPAAAARHGRPGAACRGGRPAGRAADPCLGPGAGRAAGPDPGLPAAPARRARRPRRGRLGGAGQPRPR